MENTRTRRRRSALLALTIGGLAALSLTGVAMSMAQFTDQATVPSNDFTTGTVDISTSPTTSLLSLGNMAPGDTVNGSLVVTNAGSLNLRYAMSTSSTNADVPVPLNLRSQLSLQVKTIGTSCAAFNGADVVTLALLSTNPGFGSNAQGADPGDRTLAAAASETLCFRVTLPLGTGNAYQGATTTATFTFDAEQTKNNP
jgi:spore coat-associated protein N